MTLAEHLIKTKYGGVPPKCKCRCCDELPTFYRGRFTDYAENHKVFSVRESLYKKKFGIPRCFQCGTEVGFNRGEPKKYCSRKCNGKNAGFSLIKTQDVIKKSVMEKYGIDNISKLESVKNKISKANIGHPSYHNDASRKKISEYLKKKWQEPEYIEFILNRVISNRLSKLHQTIREKLNLESFGFKSEQRIGRSLVDELHEEKKIVVEINGDYVHANPKFHEADDVIVMPGNSYTAAEKWEYEEQRLDRLKKLGYRVLVIWQSDNLEEKRKELKRMLTW